MKRFKNILYVVETGEANKPALERAVLLAENNQASLTVVDVVAQVNAGIGMPPGGPISADLQTAVIEAHKQELASLIQPYNKRLKIKTSVITGMTFLQVVREVLHHGYDLVIKIPEDQDWLDRLFGSDDMHLLRKCPCPVWLIKPAAPKIYRRILAAVDVNDSYAPDELESHHAQNRQILEIASSLSLADFTELHIVHAWEAIGESTLHGALTQIPEKEISTYIEQVRQRHASNLQAFIQEVTRDLGSEALNYLKPQSHLIKGWARKEIPQLAKHLDVDLVVMGTVGRTGIPGFIMGNTAETILNQLNCSVLAIKPPGFVTPITLLD